MKAVLVLLSMIGLYLIGGCSYRIPAEDISLLQGGKTFNREGNYQIGPGDELSIFVFGEERLTGKFNVSPTGILSYPLVPPFSVSGMTTNQLTKRLETELVGIVKSPKISVSLPTIRSFQVYFSGEVRKVGAVQLTNETSFLQAMTLAGGLTEFATGRIILIRQQGNTKVRRYSIRYQDILAGDNYVDNVSLESGDVIYAE